MPDLVIDRLQRAAEERPSAPCLAGLSNAEAWARSGAVASWLIAQGYGPDGRSLAVPAGDGVDRAVLILGALRAGALVIDGPVEIRPGALMSCSVDAAVAERRLHIDAATPARQVGSLCRTHGDLSSIADAVGA